MWWSKRRNLSDTLGHDHGKKRVVHKTSLHWAEPQGHTAAMFLRCHTAPLVGQHDHTYWSLVTCIRTAKYHPITLSRVHAS